MLQKFDITLYLIFYIYLCKLYYLKLLNYFIFLFHIKLFPYFKLCLRIYIMFYVVKNVYDLIEICLSIYMRGKKIQTEVVFLENLQGCIFLSFSQYISFVDMCVRFVKYKALTNSFPSGRFHGNCATIAERTNYFYQVSLMLKKELYFIFLFQKEMQTSRYKIEK